MGYFYRLSLLCILMTILAISASADERTPPTSTLATVRRFALRSSSTNPRDGNNLTDAQRYAKWLISKKPTQRGTAMRRQTSPTPPTPESAAMSVMDMANGQAIGSLVYSATNNIWTVSSTDTPTPLTFSGPSSGVTSRDGQRLTSVADLPYQVFGIGQCIPGGPTTIGLGSSNGLCLVNADSPGTAAGSIPFLLANNLDKTGSSYVETDIWNIDYSTGVIAPQWVNPDGTSTLAHIIVAVTNQSIIVVTGDIAATSAAYGLVFREVTLDFLPLGS